MQFVPIHDPIPGRKSGIAADREIATPIRAELIGDDQATALGIEVRSARQFSISAASWSQPGTTG